MTVYIYVDRRLESDRWVQENRKKKFKQGRSDFSLCSRSKRILKEAGVGKLLLTGLSIFVPYTLWQVSYRRG